MVRLFCYSKPRRRLCWNETERFGADEGFKTSVGEFSFK
jgi:hypothetical protein